MSGSAQRVTAGLPCERTLELQVTCNSKIPRRASLRLPAARSRTLASTQVGSYDLVTMPIARKHRLPPEAYFGPKTVAITANTQDRRPFLTDPDLIELFVSQLQECAERHLSLVPVYCFMPDHLHLLIQGTDESSRPKFAIDDFKLTSGLWLIRHRPELSWQDEYYDHIIRKSVDWRRQAFYVLNNPVRKGLVTDPYAYPFSGSVGYDLRQLFNDLMW